MGIYKRLLIICFQVILIDSAPLQVQYQSQLSLQPTQEELLQQQLSALQQLQQLQNLQMMNDWNSYYSPTLQNRAPPPMMILLPESQVNDWTQMNSERNHNIFLTKNSDDKEIDNKDLDSVVIEANSEQEPKPEPEQKKAILLIPNTRTFSIGGIISAIPFLPIEINVPDAISWIYGGISNIIGGIIGQRVPFKRPVSTPTPEQDNNVKLLLKRLQNGNQNIQGPILMMPDVAQMYPMPMQIPMQL